MEKTVKSNPDFTQLEEDMQELIEYAESGDVNEDGLNKRLDYIYEAAIIAMYGEEFYTWFNSKFE